MIIQPEKGTRNINDSFYEAEGKQINILNREFFHNVQLSKKENDVLVWLCGWDEWTIDAIVDVFRKVRNGGISIMQIETKFNVGDTVYVCKNNSIKDLETCKICDGKGTITVKDDSFCCPKCHGNKFTSTKRVRKFIPEKRTIRKVIVSVSENNGNIQIYTRYEATAHGNRNRSVADYKNIMFATKEEAEARCKELMEELA